MHFRNTDDGLQTGDGDVSDNDNSNSNLVATIAATEAAIRIASDIIDSTLAHVDDHGDHQNDSDGRNTTSSSGMYGVVHAKLLIQEYAVRLMMRCDFVFAKKKGIHAQCNEK